MAQPFDITQDYKLVEWGTVYKAIERYQISNLKSSVLPYAMRLEPENTHVVFKYEKNCSHVKTYTHNCYNSHGAITGCRP